MWALAFVLANGIMVDSGYNYQTFEECVEIGQAVMDDRAAHAKPGDLGTSEFACVEVE